MNLALNCGRCFHPASEHCGDGLCVDCATTLTREPGVDKHHVFLIVIPRAIEGTEYGDRVLAATMRELRGVPCERRVVAA